MMTLSDFRDAFRRTGSDIGRNHTMAMAAGLAYYFVLSLFPLLIVLAAITGFLPLPDMWERIMGALGRVVPYDAMGVVRAVLRDVLQSGHPRLLSLGLLGTAFGATGGFSSMIEALNMAYDVPETRPWWRTRVLALELTFGIGAFFLVALAFMIVGPEFGGWLANKIGLQPEFVFVWTYIRWGVSACLTIVGVELLYYLAPNVKQKFLGTLAGATVAVAGWLGGSHLLGLYFRHFANFNKTYGTLGAVVALLVWFYWSNVVILIGAELNAELRKAAGKGTLPMKESAEASDMPEAA